MDFRNLCSKIDVDAIRAKFPALPDVMTNMKLPKSMSKLKSRKIFQSSREDISAERRHSSSKYLGSVEDITLPPPSEFVDHTPHKISTISSLVDQPGRGRRGVGGAHGLGRGATIKRCNLEDQEEEGFYRSAGGIDDYCPSPLKASTARRSVSSKPISPPGSRSNMSPGHRSASEQSVKMSLTERVQRNCKNIFVKKTVVRQDNIQINEYVQRFEEDRRHQQRADELIDVDLDEDYDFEFKISRRKSEESFGISTPRDSPVPAKGNNRKTLSEQSGDESGMEESPPPRKAGIAATRFSRVRKEPLSMSLEEDGDHISQSPIKRKAKEQDEEEEEEDDDDLDIEDVNDELKKEPPQPIHPIESSLYKKLIQRKGTVKQTRSPEKQNKVSKRKAPLSPRQSVEDEEVQMSPVVGDQKTEKSSGVIRQNYKRLQKSIKLPSRGSAAHSGAESETEETAAEAGKTKTTKSQQFAERLKRFRSVENVDKPAEDEPDETKSSGSPLHKITSKLQDWTKSFKRRHSVAPNTDDGMNSPNKAEKNVAIFIKKLQHMRSRKQAGNEDPDDDEEGGVTYKESFKSRAKLHLEKGVAAASQMPQMTMEKLKESKKYFRKKQDKEKEKEPKQPEKIGVKQDSEESALEDSDEEMQMAKTKAKVKPKSEDKTTTKVCRDRHYYSSDDEDDDEGEDAVEATRVTLEPYQQNVLVPLTRAAWTAKPILTDSGDDEDDDILPRVLIHQDNSNVFESTLIIAVTRPVARSQTISPYITELPPDYEEESPKASPSDSPKLSTPETKADNWIPNREMISNFSEVSKTLERTLSNDDSLQSFSSARQNSRNHSMDSSSEDSWIKDVDRDVSTAIGLTGLHDMEEPWKVKSGEPGTSDNKLYKTKSIDIFETHQKDGQDLKIFEDFDDELKNTPIVRIENKRDLQDLRAATYESCDQDDSSESMDCADDDNSSRITKILKQPELEKTVPSQEILAKPTLTTQLYGNSRESLMGIQDRPQSTEDSGAEEDNEDSSSEEEGEKNDMDRPPSKAPSPPPPVSPPPPLPQCQTSTKPPNSPPQPSQVTISANVEASSPPSEIPPQYKPPMPPNRQIDDPPKIPERAAATSKVARPLVKTASMRLAYSEQVNPDDVGKVNKLISRFEPNRRPRVILRKAYILQDSEDYSDHEPEAKIEEDIAETPKKTGENETIIQDVIEDNLNIRTKKPLLQRTVSIETAELIPVPPTATIKSHLETLQEPEAEEQIGAAGICTINNKFEQQPELEAQKLPVVTGAPTMTNKTETQPDLPHVDAPTVIKNREPEASAQQVVVSTPTMNNNIESLASDEPIVREGSRHQHLDEVPLNINNNLESQPDPEAAELPIRATPPTKKNNLKPQAPEPPLIAASAIINNVKPQAPELSLEAPQSPTNNNLEQQPEPESPGLVTSPKTINNNLELQIEAETSRLPNVSAPSTINKNLGIELELKASELPITINNNNPKPQLKPEQDSTESYKSSPPIIMNSQDPPLTTTSSFNQNNNTSSNSSNQVDINANFSQPNSEYGSPMAFPSSLMGSTEVTPVVNRKETAYLNNTLGRSRRSIIGDDEAFDSFDSDEENSYYSLSSTSSSRYVVEM